MRILMLAWRDLRNPLAGGAEVITDIYLKGLVKRGHECTLFSSVFPNCKRNEIINGYDVVRGGGKLGVYLRGFLFALKHRGDFDVVIDQVNTVPFFTPLIISRKKRVALFYQLARNVWFYETPLPVAVVGFLLESLYLKLYFNTDCISISDSTSSDLRRFAWCSGDIHLSNMCVDVKPVSVPFRDKHDFVFVGRLKRSKRVHDCIRALSLVPGKSKLFIIGAGDKDYVEYLHKLSNELGLKNRVIFLGKVSSIKRDKILRESVAILVTSVREGWGLIVTEANANGTLAVTYDISGLRDSNKEGLICKRNNPVELARCINNLLNNKKLVDFKSRKSLDFVFKHLDWDKTVGDLEGWLKKRRSR